MIEKDHPGLSVRRQAELLDVNRNRLESRPRVSEADLAAMRALDEFHTRWPFYGQRKLLVLLREAGHEVGRKKVRRLMQVMGIEAIAPKRRTSVPDAGHAKYPYLLANLEVSEPDEAWCADITYIPMERGFAYLVAVMDWHTRAVLSWRLGNTLDTRFCLEALDEAVRVAGRTPGIFNTDQGCQFTSREWTGKLESLGVRVSMDGKGRWLDNVFIERLWRSLKCEDIYLRDYRDLAALEAGLRTWFAEYNHQRPHQAHGYRRPWALYRPQAGLANAA
jgi:putative transposase